MDLCLIIQHPNRPSSLTDYIGSCQHISPPPHPPTHPPFLSFRIIGTMYDTWYCDRILDFPQCSTYILIRYVNDMIISAIKKYEEQ